MSTVSQKPVSGKPVLPEKPRSDWPLFPHASGRWAKKVRGKLHYFGKWDDPEAALNKWLDEKDDLLAGRMPRARTEGADVAHVCNAFLTAKKHQMATGELQARTWQEYYETCERIISEFGRRRVVSDLTPADFEKLRAELAKTRGPVALGNEVQRVRSVFKYAFEANVMDGPVKFGPLFKKPSRKAVRLAKQAGGLKFFSASEIQKLLKAASVQLKAMILLAINAGFGNTDVAQLPVSAINFRRSVIEYPRPKTAIERRATLWPDTVKALKAAIAGRPKPESEDDAKLVFLTRLGKPWMRFSEAEIEEDGSRKEPEQKGGIINPVAGEFRKLLDEMGIRRNGCGFYSLRHTFATVADEVGDAAAVSRIMGHSDERIIANYREWLGDEREDARLRKVTDHVHAWVFGQRDSRLAGRSRKK